MGLDAIELVIAWEEAFGISITRDDMVLMGTPGKVADAIYAKLCAEGNEPQVAPNSGKPWTCEEIRSVVRSIISKCLQIAESEIFDDSNFYDDLGMG